MGFMGLNVFGPIKSTKTQQQSWRNYTKPAIDTGKGNTASLISEGARRNRSAGGETTFTGKMIKAVMVMNTQGKPRLAKFYDYLTTEKQQELIRSVYGVLCSRAETVSNFIKADSIFGPDSRLVYKHYATLYFVFIFDSSENELAMLDLIQVYVETLDKCFKNVCELDVVFNFSKMHTILNEIVFGGQVLETSSTEVMKAVEEITKLEKASTSISLVSRTVSGWQSR